MWHGSCLIYCKRELDERKELIMKLKMNQKDKELLKKEMLRKIEATIRQFETADAAREC